MEEIFEREANLIVEIVRDRLWDLKE